MCTGFENATGAAESHEHSLGARNAFRGDISGRIEGTLQTGTRGGIGVSAFMFGARVGRSFADGRAGVTLRSSHLAVGAFPFLIARARTGIEGGEVTEGDRKPHDGAREKPKAAVSRSGPPGRRFGDDEISRILQTAAELEERSHALTLDSSRGLTLEELRQVAQEAGIDPRFVDVAASHLNAPVERQVSRLAGGAYMWHFQSQVDGEIRDVDRDRILQAIRSVIGQKGELADVFGRMEWSHDDGSGPVIIGISSRDGRTEIDVTATKSTEAGIVHALGISFGGIFGGATLAGLLGVSGPFALPLVGMMGAVSYGATRLGWRMRSAWWERRLRLVIERVSSIAQDVATLPPGEPGDD